MRIVFFGSADFALVPLHTLLPDIVKVVSLPPAPKDRGYKLKDTPVAEAAKKLNLDLLFPTSLKEESFLYSLKNSSPELIVVVAYGKLLPEEVLNLAKFGSINLHPSLLPKYRGAAPIERQLLHGEKETGVTIFLLTPKHKLDAGPIILQKKEKIEDEDNATTLSCKLSNLGASALKEAIDKLISKNIRFEEQKEEEASYAPPIKNEEKRICWEEPAINIHNKIRAFSYHIGAYSILSLGDKKKRLIFWKSRLRADITCNLVEGTIIGRDEGLIVASKKGALEILELQPEGKNKMSAYDFLLGYQRYIKFKETKFE